MIKQATSTEILETGPLNKFNSFDQFKEFVETAFIDGSGIDSQLFKEVVKLHESYEVLPGNEFHAPIHEALNWKYVRFGRQVNETFYGALMQNEDGTTWQAMLGLWDEDKQRNYIYRAPVDNGDRVFFPPVPPSIRKKIGMRYGLDIPMHGSFWEWVKEHGDKIPRIPTEGGKKALALLSLGYLPFAFYGCRCGNAKDKEGVIDDLTEFTKEQTIWLIAFDRDIKETAKKAVTYGTRKLAKSLKTTAQCWVESIYWQPEQGKGVDDLIVNSGSGAFDNAYNRAILRLEKQFRSQGTPGESDTERKPSQVFVARHIAEKYLNTLAFNNEISCWMRYAADHDGMWSPETEEYIESVIYQLILSEGFENFSASFISSVVKILRHELIERTWGERSPNELLPFRNGVLNIATGELSPHAPGYRLTWQLPRDYTQSGSWDTINKFLDHLASGNQAIKDLLLCYCNAVLKGRCDLQKFVHLIGLGGTGKGTFSRLIINLIGSQNVHTTTLEEWCQNRFEGANAYRKRLVLFPDEDRQQGKLGKFLSLTGQDLIRAEEKRKKAFQYRFDGMVLVMSNFPVFGGDSASRVKRRVITVPCNKPVAPNEVRDLEAEFQPELSAFTNYLLSIPDSHVTSVLRGIREIPECTLEFWENRMRIDSIAAWLNQQIIYDPRAETSVGCNRQEGANGETIVTLFGSYVRHCNALGDIPKSHKNFAPDLLELCRSVIGWEVDRKVTNTGKFIRGLRLRIVGVDDHIPTHDFHLMQRIAAGDGSSDGRSDGSEPLPDKEVTASDGSELTVTEISQPTTEQEDNQQQLLATTESLIEHSFKPKDTIRIISCPRQPELVGREETIEKLSGVYIKTQSGLTFLSREVEKCSPSKSSPEFTALLKGDFCHCSIHNKTARIEGLVVSRGEAIVVLAGDTETIRVKLSDLTSLTWKPDTGRDALYGGELVKIIGFKNHGREFQIEYSSGTRVYVKPNKLSQPM